MADELQPMFNVSSIMRQHARERFDEYLQTVERGEVVELKDGSIANFPTIYMASRLVNNGYADAFANTRYMDTHWFAEHLRDYIESEIVSGVALPQGQFALDLAFLMLDQVEWPVVAQLLGEVIFQQRLAILELKGETVPKLESRPMSPEEWERFTGQG